MSSIGNMVNKTVLGIIAAVVFVLVGIALGPEVVTAFADINTANMSGIFLGDVLVTIADIVPFIYYLGIVIGGMTMFWAATRTSG